MKKDILFLCQYFIPENVSSATLPFDTAQHLAKQGFSVGALCGYPKEYSDEKKVSLKETIDGVEIQRLKYMTFSRERVLGRLINYFSFTLIALFKLSLIKNYRSVIVYSNPPILPVVAVLANILFGTKIVFVAYDVYPEVGYASKSINPGDLIDRVMKILNHWLYKKVTMVVALTDEMKNYLLLHRKELETSRIVTIPNWAHEKSVKPDADAYQRFGYEEGQFVVSYFGNMGTCQEMETLIEVIKDLKKNDQIRFLIVGHGNKKQHVEQETKGLKNVQVLDYLTGKEFEQAVAISSVSIVSLEKGLRGTCAPSKYYSYLQGGQPVIAIVEPDSYLAIEVEKEKIGCAVNISDVEKLKEFLLMTSKNQNICLNMGERARKLYLNKYDSLIGLEKYKLVFESILQ